MPGPAQELLGLTDAVNVDLKSWSPQAYAEVLGGDRDAVLKFIEIASPLCHLEVTTLVVPEISDSPEGMAEIAGYLASLSRDIPLHLSAYHPAWKHSAPPSSPALLAELARVAREKLRYVYLGNVAGVSADTLCPSCGATVISRRGYRIDAIGMQKATSSASCASCGSALPIIS